MSRVGLRSSAEGSSKLSVGNMNGKVKLSNKAIKNNQKQNAHQKIVERNKKQIGPAHVRKPDDDHALINSVATEKERSCDEVSIICRVPLERLSGIVAKLNIAGQENNYESTTRFLFCTDSNSNLNDDDDSTTNIIGVTLNGKDNEDDNLEIHKLKLLCLYCEKQFTSHKMQAKHVEKFHTESIDRRRCSERTQSFTIGKNKDKESFPGCIYCKKSSPRVVVAPEKDLYNLFVHMTDYHLDKYFACKPCIIRFHSSDKLDKHLQNVHKECREDKTVAKYDATKYSDLPDHQINANEQKLPKSRAQKLQQQSPLKTPLTPPIDSNSSAIITTHSSSDAETKNFISDLDAIEPVLDRLGLIQTPLPSNKKCVRSRRETISNDITVKQDLVNLSTTSLSASTSTSTSSSSTSPSLKLSSSKSLSSKSSSSTSSPSTSSTSTFTPSTSSSSTSSFSTKNRNKPTKNTSSSTCFNNEQDVVFRVPARTDIMSCVFDDNFYKDVVSNVRNNLLYHLDGKLCQNSSENIKQPHSPLIRHSQPYIRSTLVRSPLVFVDNQEIHAATSIVGLTAFPTLLTADQYGGDSSAKFRRPHTKQSWKWKWDNVKKFKLVNEGGKIIKKMKHPMFGLRDLSKLDMWTQLAMRQKHEQLKNALHDSDMSETTREEKMRLSDQLNFILDRRLLPNIILEQNEQAVIKLENEDFGLETQYATNNSDGDNILEDTFADHSFLSTLKLLPNTESKRCRRLLVLSGEWARPRCYLCMCCGTKFEKLKSLEEHKMFRHSHILSTHYEVVGRELLAGNLLCHLFIPQRALYRYENINYLQSMSKHSFLMYKKQQEQRKRQQAKDCRKILAGSIGDESTDSVQSRSNSGAVSNIFSVKSSGMTPEDDCDTDTKTTIEVTNISHSSSMQSSSSICMPSTSKAVLVRTKTNVDGREIVTKYANCTKCGRKCNGTLDLYRHMLDCSGDYIWSLAKKRKYRYYCGSKKRRPCNKQNFGLLRKVKKVSSAISREKQSTTDQEENATRQQIKTKTPPRPRASDAESIKKMLENLPPKRVCKTILPTENKNRKQKKGKIIAKQRIYNTHVLRKTRSRQLAASRLSNQKIKKNNFNRNMNRKINDRKVRTKNMRPLDKSKLNTEPTVFKEVSSRLSSVESEKNNGNHEAEINETAVNESIQQSQENVVELGESFLPGIGVEKEPNESTQSKPNLGFENADVQDKKITANKNEVSFKVNQMLNEEPTIIPVTVNDTEAATQLSQSVIPSNKSDKQQTPVLKRSKRISDCIAMLTGKLEEKLRTVEVKANSMEKDIPLANTSTQRTPKRKSICRRFIKNDVEPEQTNTKETDLISMQTTTSIMPLIAPTSVTKTLPTEIISSTPVPIDSTNQSSSSSSSSTQSVPSLQLTTNNNNINIGKRLDNIAMQYSPITQSPPQLLEHKAQTESVKIPEAQLQPVQQPSSALLLQTSALQMQLQTQPFSFQSFNTQINPQKSTNKTPFGLTVMPLNVAAQPSANIATLPIYVPQQSMRSAQISHYPILPLPLDMVVAQKTVLTQQPMVAAPLTVKTLQPHITPPMALSSNYSMEPLNLSNSNKQNNSSQDLTMHKRHGILARRQTISGLETSDFLNNDEMLPLDLSKKTQNKMEKLLEQQQQHKTPAFDTSKSFKNVSNIPDTAAIQNLASTNCTIIPTSTTQPDSTPAKHFYSNLDLLKIPQFSRNNTFAVTLDLSQQLNTATTTTISLLKPATTTAPTVTTGCIANNNKKRGSIKNAQHLQELQQPQSNAPAMLLQAPLPGQQQPQCQIQPQIQSLNKTAPVVPPPQPMLAQPMATQLIEPTKKEVNMKPNKSTPLKMDEEVINHIDDAINSVINAVKASLQQEEELNAMCAKTGALDQPIQPGSVPKLDLSTSLNTMSKPEMISQTQTQISTPALGKQSLPPKRTSMRSKTMDCRPAGLLIQTKDENIRQLQCLISPKNTTKNTQVQQPSKILELGVSNQPTVSINLNAVESENKTILASVTSNQNVVKSVLQVDKPQPKIDDFDTIAQDKIAVDLPAGIVTPGVNSLPKNVLHADNLGVSKGTEELHECELKTATNSGSSTEIPQLNIDVRLTEPSVLVTMPAESIENVNSSINNTSSGFHSSVQSENANDIKKKQRRRRKNELAAIVADQLLESFKIDSARRDNLKKLENLAYEKSEDLLLTGMLLMSSTKRSAASVFGKSQQNIANEKTLDSSKRNQKVSDDKINKNRKTTDGSLPKREDDNKLNDLEPKKGRRHSYRRKGVRVLDNQNISKLKSSLESFSIGIENKLNEYESKIAQSTKKTEKNEMKAKNTVPEENITTEAVTVLAETEITPDLKAANSILRPSILTSSSFAEPVTTLTTTKNIQTIPTTENCDEQLIGAKQSSEVDKPSTFSRDPRLNKNIHKHDQRNFDAFGEQENNFVSARTRLRSATETEKLVDDIADLDEDNYLTEIAKNVNEKIMSAENEQFISNDGFDLANDMQDDSNSKYYRPPTSMSVRSAPGFNDDLSNFGSMCDDNTNTEVMDMDLDDELSVYTSYSQDVGRGRGRRRRRRRSILLKRRPKKRPGRDLSGEKFECFLCKKTFFSANSLTKHNQTLAHVSKLSEQEYLQSKSMQGAFDLQKEYNQVSLQSSVASADMNKNKGSYSRITNQNKSAFAAIVPDPGVSLGIDLPSLIPKYSTPIADSVNATLTSQPILEAVAEQPNEIVSTTEKFNLELSSDERLFYDCCSILQGNESNKKSKGQITNLQKTFDSPMTLTSLAMEKEVCTPLMLDDQPSIAPESTTKASAVVPAPTLVEKIFRDPPIKAQPTVSLTKTANLNVVNPTYSISNRRSPSFPAISQFSAVTNTTTSRFKTKAAMKGYENEHLDFTLQRESRTTCKLTELADIALNSQHTTIRQQQLFPSLATNLADLNTLKTNTMTVNNSVGTTNLKSLQKEQQVCNAIGGRDHPKTVETPNSSTSSKTIMHSSIIKAAVNDNTKALKIFIPERPFKNIGLEEKEPITFQKPNTNSLSLLNDENSISTGSYSDRDDYDFGTLSCDEDDTNIKATNDKLNRNSSDSSSSRATAKTFENKSLIMGRIFKNASTKAKSQVFGKTTVKSVGVQKDQATMTAVMPPAPAPVRADLNQLFDELRGADAAPPESSLRNKQEPHPELVSEQVSVKTAPTFNSANIMQIEPTNRVLQADLNVKIATTTITTNNTATTVTANVPIVTSAKTMTRKSKADRKSKSNSVRKSRKDISKLQSELGMSPEDIEKLIDEGQRKSKRRCATNTQRKLVEMWSSDEYEEFLSTKDIIALIEEKEQQEKRRKRKSSVNNGDGNSIHSALGTATPKTPNAVAALSAQTKAAYAEEEGNVNSLKSDFISQEPQSASLSKYGTNTNELTKKKNLLQPKNQKQQNLPEHNQIRINKTKKLDAMTNISTKKNTKLNEKSKIKGAAKGNDAIMTKTSLIQYTELNTLERPINNDATIIQKEFSECNEICDKHEGDNDDANYSGATNKLAKSKRSSKIRKTNNVEISKLGNSTDVSSNIEINNKKRGTGDKNSGTHNINYNSGKNNNNNNTVTRKNKQNKKGKQNKPKSSSRRKRPATEKLYYWSSSSDEDFGRIDKVHADEYEDDGSEQYQKHGWIVGDSHKKLVTLLAIAKGNKKNDNGGVKKNNPKKKS